MSIKKEVKVGLLVIVSAAVFALGFSFLKGSSLWNDQRVFNVYYDNIQGLTKSNPVYLQGNTVGRVSDILFVNVEGVRKVNVQIQINDGTIPIGEKTTAILAASDFLGGMAIYLEANDEENQYVGGEILKSGTKKSITDEIEEQLEPVLGTVDTTFKNLNHFFDESNTKSVQNIIKNLERATRETHLLVRSSRKSTDTVFANLVELSKSLKDLQGSLNPLVGKFSEFADSLNTLDMAETLENVNKSMGDLQQITQKINDSEGSLGLLLNDKKLYNNLSGTLDTLKQTVDHFNVHPHYYLKPLGEKLKKKDPHYKDPKYIHLD